MPPATYLADVYISYAGNDTNDEYTNSRDEIVQKICSQLEQEKFRAREYKRDVQYKDEIDEYMIDIASADFIILLISEKYLKSEYCMYEAIELLNMNKRGLKEKIFPVVLVDANIFDDNKQIEYIDYWEKLNNELDEKLKGKDAKKYMSLYEKGIRYREISENMDPFLKQLNKMCQLSKGLVIENNYQVVIDSIMKKAAQKYKSDTPIQASAAEQNQDLILSPQILNNNEAQNIAALSKSANDFMSLVINKVDDTILDSEKAKKEYININFEEISGEGEILPATLNFIFNLRTDKTKYEFYRQSLIISALSLGLIKKYNETKARLLIDFATDDDPVLSYRALTGVALGLLDKEDYISEDIKRKLETLQDNVKIQRCLLVIFFFLGNIEQLHRVANSLQNLDYNKFEFFNLTQHWFQPFYEGNPILKENVPDKKFATGLLESAIFLGLDNSKYALALLFSTLTKENIDEFKKFCELDKSVTNFIKTDYLKSKFLLEIEVSKYVLEFYIYASMHNNAELINLIEDKEELRTGYLYKLVLNETYQSLLKANQHFAKKEYAEAAQIVKPVLEDQPNNIEALLMYGYSSYYSGNYVDVIPPLEKVKTKAIKEIQLFAILGDAYFFTQNYEKAIEIYEQLLGIQNNTVAIMNIGRSYQLKENPDLTKALDYHLEVFKLEPENYYNLLLIGDCYANQNPPDYANAFDYYEKAFVINNNDTNLLKVLTTCANKLPQLEFERCERIYSKYIELEPQNIHPYLSLGDSYATKEPPDYTTAFEYYFKAFEIDNNNLGLIKFLHGFIDKLDKIEFEKSNKIYSKFIELEPENPSAYDGMGYSYTSKTPPDYELAFDYHYKAFEINGASPLIEVLFACAARFENPVSTKIEVLYSKYKELEPNSVKPDQALARFYEEKTEPDFVKAEDHYMQALKIDTANKELLFSLGKFYQTIPKPDFTKSFHYLNECLKLDPADFYANFYLGWGNFITGNYDAAKLYLENCNLAGEEDKAVFQNLGHIALIQNDRKNAKELYKKSHELFENKEEFYSTSMNDFKYLEKAGINHEEFDSVLREVMSLI